jgi:hypothetical protein
LDEGSTQLVKRRGDRSYEQHQADLVREQARFIQEEGLSDLVPEAAEAHKETAKGWEILHEVAEDFRKKL